MGDFFRLFTTIVGSLTTKSDHLLRHLLSGIHSERRTFLKNDPLPSPRGISVKLFGPQELTNFGGKNIISQFIDVAATSFTNLLSAFYSPFYQQTLPTDMNIFGLEFGQAITHDSGSRIHYQYSRKRNVTVPIFSSFCNHIFSQKNPKMACNAVRKIQAELSHPKLHTNNVTR